MAFAHTVGRILELAAAAAPDQLSVTLSDQALTFAESEARAQRMAEALQDLGLRPGDRLMYWGPISLREIDVFFATQKLGVAFVPFKDSLTIDEAVQLVEYVRPALFVLDVAMGEQWAELAARTTVRHGTAGYPQSELEQAFSAASGDRPLPAVDDEAIHAIFLTSGSTGRPKGVMVSHRASWSRSYAGMTRSPFGGGSELNTFPLFHWAGWNFLLTAWFHTRTCHLSPRADGATLNGLIRHWGPRALYAVPAVWERILDEGPTPNDGALQFACTGTYRYEPALVDRILQRFERATLTSGWGATELGTGATIEAAEQRLKAHSVGLPCPGVELRIVDGELQGRTDQMMSGYFDMPAETGVTLTDGWYRTGDLAERDQDGYVTIVGRVREVIRSGAETIAPAEVEAALNAIPGIADACVVGLPDLQWGEIVCAVIVPEAGSALPTVDDLRRELGGKLARFKHPRRVAEASELPRTPATGQIRRGEVRAQIAETLSRVA